MTRLNLSAAAIILLALPAMARSEPLQPLDQPLQSAGGAASQPDFAPTGAIGRPQPRRDQDIDRAFAFEVGTRYWYSSGSINFAFSNHNPAYGNPTSTLDWNGLTAHSGEVFARVDHKPSGLFVKGLFGAGFVTDGHVEDADFAAGQIRFSDTTSDVKDGNLAYAMFDIGWAYAPRPDFRVGVFAGYHFWREQVTAYGVLCNQTTLFIAGCPGAGAVLASFNTAVLTFQPTWHAVRLGVDGKFAITDRWSVSGEVAAIPFAVLENDDSHLLRQSPADLGPAPNIITNTGFAYGVETELFVNYAVTPYFEIGGGLRYWGLTSRDGSVRFGPTFSAGDTLNSFDQQRYGALVQAKGKF